jgi:KaiC/GvpD/RAD55 family RecA-like ATPase
MPKKPVKKAKKKGKATATISKGKKEVETLLKLLEGVAPPIEGIGPMEKVVEKAAPEEETAEDFGEERIEKLISERVEETLEKGVAAEAKEETKAISKSAQEAEKKGEGKAEGKEAEKKHAGKKGKAGKKGENAERVPKVSVPEVPALPVSYLFDFTKGKVILQAIPRVPSGIPGLDDMLDGGLEENSIILVNGDPGSGKSIFGLQFLHDALKRGEAALYISFGEPRELIYARMLSFGMDLKEYEDKKLFFMIEYQPHEVAKLMGEEGGTIHDIVTAYKVKRIVIDTITPYLAQYSNVSDARIALVRMSNVIRKWGATTILLNEWSPHVEQTLSALLVEFHADGVINLIHERTGDGVQVRGIEIWKMSGINHAQIARPFAFTKKGIIIYPTERLFAAWKEREKM